VGRAGCPSQEPQPALGLSGLGCLRLPAEGVGWWGWVNGEVQRLQTIQRQTPGQGSSPTVREAVIQGNWSSTFAEIESPYDFPLVIITVVT